MFRWSTFHQSANRIYCERLVQLDMQIDWSNCSLPTFVSFGIGVPLHQHSTVQTMCCIGVCVYIYIYIYKLTNSSFFISNRNWIHLGFRDSSQIDIHFESYAFAFALFIPTVFCNIMEMFKFVGIVIDRQYSQNKLCQ